MEKVNLEDKLSRIAEPWQPRIAAELNGQYVKLVKFEGEFVWHQHEKEDELFLVLKGLLVMKLRDRDIVLHPGEFLVVPRGVEHMPVAKDGAEILLFEPKSTLNTGNVRDERTLEKLDWI